MFQRIAGKTYALYKNDVDIQLLACDLLEIVIKYNLVRDIKQFFIVDCSPYKQLWYRTYPELGDSHEANILRACISVIGNSVVKKFPSYKFQARHRRAYGKV